MIYGTKIYFTEPNWSQVQLLKKETLTEAVENDHYKLLEITDWTLLNKFTNKSTLWLLKRCEMLKKVYRPIIQYEIHPELETPKVELLKKEILDQSFEIVREILFYLKLLQMCKKKRFHQEFIVYSWWDWKNKINSFVCYIIGSRKVS